MQAYQIVLLGLLWAWAVGLGPTVAMIVPRIDVNRLDTCLNSITLLCRTTDEKNNTVPFPNAEFWVDSPDKPLTSLLDLSDYQYRLTATITKIEFVMHPTIEGTYYCGNISGEIQSENNIILTGT